VFDSQVPGKMLTCVGRCHYGDLGEMATGVRLGEKCRRLVLDARMATNVDVVSCSVVALVPYDFLTGVFSYFAPLMGDYKKYNKVGTLTNYQATLCLSDFSSLLVQDRGVEEE
jgi:hypothetical protein